MKIILLFLVLSLIGCSSKLDTIEVKVPTAVYLNKPDRPIRQKNEKAIEYLIKIIGYVEKLEMIILENNKRIK